MCSSNCCVKKYKSIWVHLNTQCELELDLPSMLALKKQKNKQFVGKNDTIGRVQLIIRDVTEKCEVISLYT